MTPFVNPTPFSGLSQEDPKVWFTYLERWAQYKNLTDEQVLRILPLLFRLNSLIWFDGFYDTMKASVNAVKHAFQTRFYDSDLGSRKGMCDLWKRKQGLKETVGEYVDMMQKIKRVV